MDNIINILKYNRPSAIYRLLIKEGIQFVFLDNYLMDYASIFLKIEQYVMLVRGVQVKIEKVRQCFIIWLKNTCLKIS